MTAVDGDHSAYIDTTVTLSGAAIVVPGSLDLSSICNGAADDGDWKVNLAAQIESQREQPHTWTGEVTVPSVN
jgi:hypothetical protein